MATISLSTISSWSQTRGRKTEKVIFFAISLFYQNEKSQKYLSRFPPEIVETSIGFYAYLLAIKEAVKEVTEVCCL